MADSGMVFVDDEKVKQLFPELWLAMRRSEQENNGALIMPLDVFELLKVNNCLINKVKDV